MGDIESAPFVEAMRQFQFRVGHENFALIHVSLVPDMHGEQKTKPTQTTVHALRGLGLLPDLVSVKTIDTLYRNFICLLDCMPLARSSTTFIRYERQNIHVLPRLIGASIRRARRLVRLSRSTPPPIARHCVLPPKTT